MRGTSPLLFNSLQHIVGMGVLACPYEARVGYTHAGDGYTHAEEVSPLPLESTRPSLDGKHLKTVLFFCVVRV